MSEAELQKMLNVYVPDKAVLQRILRNESEDDAVAALNEMLSGVVRQATTTSWYQSQLLQRQLADRMSPIETFYQQQQQEREQKEFFKSYGDLEPFVELLPAVQDAVDKAGMWEKVGKDKKKYFEAVAKTAENWIQKANPSFKLGAGSAVAGTASGGSTVASGAPKMAQLSAGGTSGAGGQAGGEPPNILKQIFG
jgi:hypothetical protein